MRKKIAYIITTAAIALTAFFIGKNMAETENIYSNNNNIETMESAFSQIEYIEVTDNGFDFYTFDGNIYEWR